MRISIVSIALFLASIGLFGIIAYNVKKRTQELGIRMALGAQSFNIQWMILKESGRLLLMGTLLGIVFSINVHYLMRSKISISTENLLANYTLACVILAGVALIASYIPARWASKVDPMAALRAE
jgi:ABC-type antimicrobial peptide transport system permease subunit